MNIRFTLLILFLELISFSGFAQEYFQQEVNYEIHVRLDDKNHSLDGKINIEYTNNSPEKLTFIYFHLWPNAYKNNNTAFAKQLITNNELEFQFAKPEDKGYINSLEFNVNGKNVKWEYHPEHIDICILILNNAVLPGEKIKISTPFKVQIPSAEFSRLGHDGQTYNITQWYPKPAVFDKYGWHEIPYLEQGEFYSEFGSFNVYITLPDNYVVAATGNLQNENELNWLNARFKETQLAIANNSLTDSIPVSSKNLKTLHYSENNIHDFAWWAGKQYYVLKDSVELPNTGRIVNTWAFFTKDAGYLWFNALDYINDALFYYSKWLGDYPYNNCTAIYGELGAGGGMEYPTITTIGSSGNAITLEQVIMHEVGHNWFYGILGTNEREFPFLDEGLNSYYEQRYIETKYPDFKFYQILLPEKPAKLLGLENYRYSAANYYGYLSNARQNIDQPITETSENYTYLNYVTTVYQKSTLVFSYLQEYLGEELMDTIMRDYFQTWKYKHPYPQDLEQIFLKHTTKDLSWFFEDILKTTNTIDYKICKYKNNSVLIKNTGSIVSPFNISALKDTGIIYNQWEDGFKGEKWISFTPGESDKIVIDYKERIPEIYRKNNYLKTKGILPKTEPLKLQFAGILENPKYTQLNYLPTIGYNYYDNIMPGLLLYNNLWPPQNFEFQLLPFYSFKNNMINGSANFEYHFNPADKLFQNASISFSGLRYGSNKILNNYNYRVGIETRFDIKKRNLRSPFYNKLILNAISVPSELFYNFKYTFLKKNKLKPLQIDYNIQATSEMVKSWIEVNSSYMYKLNKKIELRFFAGKFIYKKQTTYVDYRFRMSGWRGEQDYLNSNTFLGRFEDIRNNTANVFLSHQFVASNGAFGIFTILGQTDNWMASINSTFDFPMPLPVKFYINLATFTNANSFLDNGFLFYETGLKIGSMNGLINVFFPMFYSSEIDKVADLNNYYDNYWQKIRFTINLNRINPFLLAKEFVYF